MTLRFDHAVIGVRHLDETATEYAHRLGFSVYLGGSHTGLGTHNVIARFGLDYLELLGVYNVEQALGAGVSRAALVDYIRQHRCGALGYALATDDLDGIAERLRNEGVELVGPVLMQRKRMDGVVLEWRVLLPGGTAWRRPWPFFIEWGTPDAERLQHEKAGKHLNGVQGVRGVAVAMQELVLGKELYGGLLGLTQTGEGDTDEFTWARYGVGDFTIDVVCPRTAGSLQAHLDTFGQGLYQIWLASATAAAHLAQRSIPTETVHGPGGLTGIRVAEGCGADLVFTQ